MAEGTGLAIVRATQLADKRLVGGGGFGKILRARHTEWGIDVALKMLHGSTDRCAENQNLLREAELMNSLRFRHVVCLIGLYRDPAEPLGIVMEFMENGSLASLQERVTVPWPLRVRLIHEVALGMNYLHGLDPPLLHLDLNPRNVLLDDGFHAKIADFGLSKLKQIVSCTPCGSVAGTLEYLPPEALKSEIHRYKPTAAADVYSFGILMWSVLSGKPPYNEVRQRDIIKVLIPENQRPDRSLLPSQESVEKLEDLKELMEKCWHNEPEQRPPFADCRVRTDEAFQAHRASVADAVHRVGNIMRTLATSSSIWNFSDGVGDPSLRDGASERIGELRTEQSTGPESPPPAAAGLSVGNGPWALEETTSCQPSGPASRGAMSATNHDRVKSPGPTLSNSQECKPTSQIPHAQETVPRSETVQRSSGRSFENITILSSKIEGLQIGHGNTMNITKVKVKKKARR